MAQKLCDKYFNLTPLERSAYTGQLIHAVISSDELYLLGKDLIDMAVLKGLFKNGTLNPPPIEDKKEV